VLGTAEEWDCISDNPVRKARLPRRDCKLERSIFTTEQIKRLLVAPPEPSKSVATLLALTGLRIGELLALCSKSIDLAARTLRISETVYDGHFDSPKARRSVRSIPIGSESISILSALLSSKGEPDSLVFSTCSDQPLCRRNLLHRRLQPACARLGLRKIP
jgi:integrase